MCYKNLLQGPYGLSLYHLPPGPTGKRELAWHNITGFHLLSQTAEIRFILSINRRLNSKSLVLVS